MRQIILALTATTIMAGAAYGQTNRTEVTDEDKNLLPSVSVDNAKIEGSKITGVSVTMNRPGYVVIHDGGAGAPPASLGHMWVEAGETSDLSIDATQTLDPAQGVTLMLHYETNNNKSYDFGPGSTDVDTPVMGAEGVINVAVPQ